MKKDKLLERMDPEEAVKSFVFPVDLSEGQKKRVSTALAKARRRSLDQMTEEEKRSISLLQLRFQVEDYISNQEFHPDMRIGPVLKRYLQILNKKRVDFASEISIHETLLSQLINNRRRPSEIIIIRLELHSNNCIPAEYWLRLIEKERIHHIRTNQKLRKEERSRVSKNIRIQI